MLGDGGGHVECGGRVPLVFHHPRPDTGERRPALPGQLLALQTAVQDTHHRAGLYTFLDTIASVMLLLIGAIFAFCFLFEKPISSFVYKIAENCKHIA